MKHEYTREGGNITKWTLWFEDFEEMAKGIPEDLLKAIKISLSDKDIIYVNYTIEIEKRRKR